MEDGFEKRRGKVEGRVVMKRDNNRGKEVIVNERDYKRRERVFGEKVKG